ncbi:MAG: FtsX-like permease family protein [Anaerolineae bacterium]|nr:MAG: FtsX-like permease family protein [Anaerolineae bacterium]
MERLRISSQWVKIINDIWGHKSRSMLVVLSIAVGVAVVGMINNARYYIERDLYGAFSQGTPASIQIYVSYFPESLADEVEGLRYVAAAQARRDESVELVAADGKTFDAVLSAAPDYSEMRVNQIEVEEGAPAPSLRGALVERQAAEALGIDIGDVVVVRLQDNKTYELHIQGIVHDLYALPYSISSEVMLYTNLETIQWIGGRAGYNRLDVLLEGNPHDRETALTQGTLIRDRLLEPAGYRAGSILIPGIQANPGEHWAQNQVQGFILILQIMSAMAIFLSGGLVVNTITAILNQQVKQIGIMRSVGAERLQIARMYVFNVLIFSLGGLALALPLGLLGSIGLGEFAASFLNFDLTLHNLAPDVLAIEIVIALAVPMAVALWPILKGTAISVYQAIYQYGQIQDAGMGRVQRLLFRLKFLPPPVMMSLQNTFRNLPRLGFTVITLTMAGATFVAALSTRASLNAMVGDLIRYAAYDVAISLSGGANRLAVQREAFRLEGVEVAEVWTRAGAVLMNPNGSEGEQLALIGLPVDTVTIDVKLLEGRWLVEGDARNLVLNEDLAQLLGDIEIGDTLRLKIGDTTRPFTVVGIASRHLSGPSAYLPYAELAKITGRSYPADEVRIRTSLDGFASQEEQDALAVAVEERFSNAGLSDSAARPRHNRLSFFSGPFQIILVVLVIMAGLLGIVGGLSLTGTMGINVLERTREIGVLRAVGATNPAIRQVVVVEGIFVAIVSWGLVTLISPSTSAALAAAVITAVLRSDVVFSFSFAGLLYWLGIVVIIGAVASLAPARSAVTLTVREVLDYE